MAKLLKTSYNIHHQVESFFTGSQIEFDQDGKHFFCADKSVINKVSIEDGQVKAQIKGQDEDDNIIRFALCPQGALIIIAYHSGLIMKFNLIDETVERVFKSIHTAPITFMRINPSGTLLATASTDGTVKLWNLKNHYCSHNLKGVNGVISSVIFQESSLGDLLFCAAGNDNIYIFDIESSKNITKLTTHCSTITDMKLTDDGNQLISVSRDKIAVIWNISRTEPQKFGTPIRTIPIYESIESFVILDAESISTLLGQSVEEDRVFFATIGEEGTIKFWDTKTGSKIFTQNEPPLSQDRSPGSICFQLCLRPESKQVCAVSSERDIFIYDLPKLDLAQQLQGHIDEIFSACWFADDNYLAIACNSNDLKVIEVNTSKTQHLKGHKDVVLCVKSVPSDPMCILSSSKDCSVLIWKFDPDTMAPSIIYRATGHTHAVHALAVLGDERIFFSGGEDTTLKRWSFVESRKEKRKREIDNSDNSPSDTLIAIQTIKAHDERIDDIAVSPNDQLVATGSRDKTVKIFSSAGLQILATLRGHRRGVYSVQFSPIDQVLVSAGDSTLRMWNLQDFTCVKTFQGHDCAVLNFAFLSSGLQMISVASDGNMKLWDCKTNECTKTIDAHSGNTWALSLTADDGMIATAGQDEKLVIWRDTTKEDQENRLANLQTQVMQEQDFVNYINKKKWRKAFKMAIAMENHSKSLAVVREILLEPDGTEELELILMKCRLDQIDFIIDCCISWMASAKNSWTAQQVFNIIVRKFDNEQLLRLPNLARNLEQLKNLTEKSFSRYERLVQQATFADFFLSSLRIH